MTPDLFTVVSILVVGLLIVSLVFAGSAVGLRLRHERSNAAREAAEESWREAVFDYLAGEGRRPTIWERVGPDATRVRWFVDDLVRLARRLRGEDNDRLAELAEPFLPLVVEQLESRAADRRALAAETLGLLGAGKHNHRVRAVLDDRSPLVAIIAARALVRKPREGDVEALTAQVPRFDAWSRRLLASLLASIGPQAAPALRDLLEDIEQTGASRAAAAESLRLLNDLESADLAARIVAEEDEREIVAACLRLLAQVGRPNHADAVRRRTESEDFVLRAHAVTAFARLAPRDEAGELRRHLDDASPWVATHAAQGLREAGQLAILRDVAASDHPRAELARQVMHEEA